jgi:hypothetical protein
MAYTKTNWVPRTGTNLNKYTKPNETANSVVLVNAPDGVTQAGTPYSAENMNHIEQGIYDAHELAGAAQTAAGNALPLAQEAQSTANDALSAAQAAQETANEALVAAGEAQPVTDITELPEKDEAADNDLFYIYDSEENELKRIPLSALFASLPESGGEIGGAGSRIPGEYRYLSFQPTPLQLVEWRLLELKYQIIETALYPELCALKYIGDDKNAAADWWYKCAADGTRNVNGLYMRVEDPRGLFFRAAGANALHTAADGGEAGAFEPFGTMGRLITRARRP